MSGRARVYQFSIGGGPLVTDEGVPDARIGAESAFSLPDPGEVIDLQVYNLLQLAYTRLGEEDSRANTQS